MKKSLFWLVIALLGASCAIPEPPPGGPEDKTAPEVVVTQPPNGSAGIAPDAEISIEFSEKMNRTRFERNVELSPAAAISKARWKGNTVILQFEGPLNPDTTYLVTVKQGFADAHNVRNDEPFEFAFATSAEIDTGSISGKVFFRRNPSEKAVVRLFTLPADSAFSPEAGRPDREARTGEEGGYELKYLPARGGSFFIWAFQDANGNGVFERDGEVGAALPDTVVLTRASPRAMLQDIYIVDPKEPASIAGVVFNTTPYDSLPVSLALHQAADTLGPSYYVLADDMGRYTFKSVLKGTYALHAFIDLAKDSVCGSFPCPEDSATACPEYCVDYPDSVRVSPGDEIRLMDLRLEPLRRNEE